MKTQRKHSGVIIVRG